MTGAKTGAERDCPIALVAVCGSKSNWDLRPYAIRTHSCLSGRFSGLTQLFFSLAVSGLPVQSCLAAAPDPVSIPLQPAAAAAIDPLAATTPPSLQGDSLTNQQPQSGLTIAQTIQAPTAPLNSPDRPPAFTRPSVPPAQRPFEAPPAEEELPPALPPPEELLPAPSIPQVPQGSPGEVPTSVFVQQFAVEGSTVFSPEQLATVAKQAVSPAASAPDGADASADRCPQIEAIDVEVNRPLSFAELLQARSAVTQLYIDCGYITSGAYIPPQTLENGVVTIQVIEGRLEEINVTGTRRLNSGYVRSRLELAASPPLNRDRLLEGLKLLQLDPLIETISADLQAGTTPGTSVLQVQVAEANTFNPAIILDNSRSPSVGTFRRQIQLNQGNLIGFGDALNLAYVNTDGSNEFTGSYTVPVNPRNGTVQLSGGFTDSRVIEPPFDVLDITSNYHYVQLTLRQPIVQTSTEEFSLGLIGIYQESQTAIGFQDIGPFPLSPGADNQGRTRISALRFFQEWTKRDSRQVLAARSQFSLGLDVLDATVNEAAPDSRFFAWRGQGQWVRLLAPDLLLLVQADAQLSGDALLPVEQFSLGGDETVRGYRQDFLLTDNGARLSAEVRLPVLRVPSVQGLLQVVPFVDAGTGWNNDIPNPDPNTLVGVGVGLLWQMGDLLSARLDWGIPLVEVESRDRTWQENGIYFSLILTPF